jgi:hypothetical protein
LDDPDEKMATAELHSDNIKTQGQNPPNNGLHPTAYRPVYQSCLAGSAAGEAGRYSELLSGAREWHAR